MPLFWLQKLVAVRICSKYCCKTFIHRFLENEMAGNLYSRVFTLPASALKMPNSIQPSYVWLAATPVTLVAVLLQQIKKPSWPQ